MAIPTYHDGKPTNLPAAILDAMYWLRVLRSRLYDEPLLPLTEQREHQAHLRLAIQALEGFLPPDDQSDTGAKQAKANLIKEKLRAKQQAMREAEG